ncbi:MAG: hypothetical protein RIQ46_1402 [Pseudomonadota bacterium]|jgi:glyoxylase-like metal-dependent hydrolase (beta-lactamase superfamily II)
MTHRFNALVLSLLIIFGLPAWWLLFDNSVDPLPPRRLDIVQLRELAQSLPGNAPHAVEVEQIASQSVPQTLFAAGSGLKLLDISAMAFRLPVKDGRPIVIDSGLLQTQADAQGFSHYSFAAQARVNAVMADAGLVLVTHEHVDHLGGLVALAQRSAVLERTLLNRRQIDNSRVPDAAAWPAGLHPVAKLGDGEPQAVAPGVVVIPAPHSHTPGSQMIFVRLADGREYLFTGDISPLTANWQQLRLRSRLLSEHVSPSNRVEVHAWLQAIRQMKQAAPDLVIVPGHDLLPLTMFDRRPLSERGFNGAR